MERWTLLRRRRDAFLVPFLIVLVAGIWLMVRQPRIYSFETALRFEPAGSILPVNWPERQGREILATVTSGGVLEAAARRANAAGGSVTPEELAHGLSAQWENGGRIMRITLLAADPESGQSALLGLIETLTRNAGETEGTNASESMSAWVHPALDTVRNRLRAQSERLDEVTTAIMELQAEAGIVTPEVEHDRLRARRAELVEKVGEKTAEERALRESQAVSKWPTGLSLQDDVDIHRNYAADDKIDIVRFLRRELVELELEHLRLLAIYQAGHPRLMEISEKRHLIEERMKEELAALPSSSSGKKTGRRKAPVVPLEEQWRAMSRLAVLAAEKKFLNNSLRRHDEELARVEVLAAKIAPLRREAALVERAVGALVEKEQLLQTELPEVGGKLIPISLPVRPRWPLRPNFPRYALVTVLLAFLFGISMVFLAEQTDQTFTLPEDVAAELNLPGRGIIPDLSGVMNRAAGGPDLLDSGLCLHFAPNSVESEAFRLLRTNLLHSHRQDEFRILAVVSPTSRCGASTVAANLALGLAQIGHKTILVDCDLRRPSLHTLFRQDNALGLTNLLTGLEIGRVLRSTPVADLLLIPAGPIPPNPSDMLGPDALGVILDALKKEAQFVLLNVSTLGEWVDALAPLSLADRVCFLVGLGLTEKGEARRALDMLHGIDCRCIDLVCNRADRDAG
jgi:capsular exopolysaccharide synthesis family protein